MINSEVVLFIYLSCFDMLVSRNLDIKRGRLWILTSNNKIIEFYTRMSDDFNGWYI